MPDAHMPDCVTEANRDEIRRMGSLLHRLEDQNQHGKQRDEIRKLQDTIELQGDLILKYQEKVRSLNSQLQRFRNGARI
jgi:hypothetical protein